MEEFQNSLINRKHNPKKARKILLKLKIESNLDPQMLKTHKLAQFKFNNQNFFENLKKHILAEINDEIRYNLIKVLYHHFPERSSLFLIKVLMIDYNYNFNTINFSEDLRYNVNDILNNIIINKKHKKQMVDDIVNNNLIQFAISWKDYKIYFNIFYDLNLKCFILFSKEVNSFIYFCSRLNDPFDFISFHKILTISDISFKYFKSLKILNIAVQFLKRFLNLQERDIKLAISKTENSVGTPNFKIFCDRYDFVIYIDKRHEYICDC